MRYPNALVAFLLLLAGSGNAQVYLGNYTGYSRSGKALVLSAGQSSVRFMFYRPDVLRVDFLPTPSTVIDSSIVVIRDTTENVVVSFDEDDSSATFASSAITVVCRKNPLRFSYRNSSGRRLLDEPSNGGFATSGNERWAVYSMMPEDHFYGTGERGTSLDKRGQSFESYNTQVFGYTTPQPTMSISIPFLPSTKGCGIYIDNTYRGRYDLGSADPTRFLYQAYGGELSCYLIVAPTVAEQLEKYTWLTGRQPMPPKWALGFIQSRFGYRNEAEARAMVQTMRDKHIPCDAIVLDLYWFRNMGDLAWDPSAFPNPQQMMTDFLAQGFKTVVITEPYITAPSLKYSEAEVNGSVATNTTGQPYRLENWWSCGCNATLLDITKPSAQRWWWSKHPPFLGSRIAGLWTDLGEPERHPADMRHYLGSTAKIHNIYNLLWAQTIFEGISQSRPNERFFNLTRSGFAGIQRYGIIPWSGDVGKSFGGLSVQLPMMLNMGMSGLAYHNSDIGGFCCGDGTTPELYIRWMQYGTFCPIARAHGVGQPTEPWGYGVEAEAISKKFIELRYRLLPYIYTWAHKNYETGLPLARPLFFDYPADAALLDESSSYLWGDAMLVSPVVVSGQTEKSVYLPQGTWVDFWTDALYRGGQSVAVAASLDKMPLLVRTGSIIPMQPVMNYADERPSDTLMLAVYPEYAREARFSLYEDDGRSLAYQAGAFGRTLFVQNTTGTSSGTALTLSINETIGSYIGQPARRVYLSVLHGISRSPSAVSVNGRRIALRASYDDLRQNGDGYFFDSAVLYVHTPTVPDSSYTILAENIQLAGAVHEAALRPEGVYLGQNYPNPFNPTTNIEFRVASRTPVTLRVYDLLGKEVATLVNEVKTAGMYRVQWDAHAVSAGIYYCRLATERVSLTKTMVLLR